MKAALKKAVIRSGALRAASRIRARRAAILRYHSVLPVPEDFGHSIGFGIIHSRDEFAKQMALLACRYHPVSIDQVSSFVRGDTDLPLHSVAVTFDDGFADNLGIAAPILADFAIPAAIYLAVDYIGNRTPPWYCRLRHAFSVSKVSEWRTETVVYDMAQPEQRRHAFVDSSRRCAQLCRNSQERLLGEIEHRLKVESFNLPIMLTWQGARQLLAQGHIIGSHSLSHPNLAYVDSIHRTEEIVTSKAKIEQNTGTECKHFSYPSPIMEPHYSDATVAVTKAAGYCSAVTCTGGAVLPGDQVLSLKRLSAPPNVAELEWALENAFVGRSV